jgi:hypothetical protein
MEHHEMLRQIYLNHKRKGRPLSVEAHRPTGLYCVLWSKNKEETLAAMASGHLEQSREQGDADAASCTSTSVIFKNQDEDKEAGGRLEPFNHIT